LKHPADQWNGRRKRVGVYFFFFLRIPVGHLKKESRPISGGAFSDSENENPHLVWVSEKLVTEL